MNDLHLFAGIGGGILGSLLLGHRIVCAVEIEPYCQSVLVQRQNDGRLPPFPIWDDIRTFDGRDWRGIVDVVSGGFPCQNISPAGDRSGITGEKSSLWFEMLRVIREVRPKNVFVENSAGLIRRGLDVVLGGLSEAGYDAEWCVLGADDVGAIHHRKRVWILAYAKGERCSPQRLRERKTEKKPMLGIDYQNTVFPTPGTTGLSNGSGNCRKLTKLKEAGVLTSEECRNMRSGNGGRLNPQFVEWLMGVPIDWTDLKDLEMPKSRSVRQPHGKYCMNESMRSKETTT